MGDLKEKAAAKRAEMEENPLTKGPEITTEAVSTPSAAVAAIDKAYQPGIKALGETIGTLEKAKKDAVSNDEVAQRRARNMQMVAGLSDGLAALANMIGVGEYNASPINVAGASPELAQKFEAARLERKADIKSIEDRLEQKQRELQAMKMQYGSARASQISHEKDKVQDRLDKLEERRAREAFEEKILAQQQKFAASESQLDRESQEAIAEARNASTQATSAARAQAAAAKNRPEYILFDEEGKETRYSIPKNTDEAISKNFNEYVAKDMESDTSTDAMPSKFRQAVQEYERISTLRGFGGATDQQVKDARNAVIASSPTMREMISKYGEVITGEDAAELDDVDALLEENKLEEE